MNDLLSVREPRDSDFAAVKDYIPDVLVELKYAADDNFTGHVIYEFQDVYLRYGTVKKLMLVQQELKTMGLGLKIWDGFRPVSAQFKLWEICPDSNYVANPNKGYSNHSRGYAVDLTVVDRDGNEIEMPTGFDDFSTLADRDYSDCSEKTAANALMLQNIMEKHGFSGYFGEWWHFNDTVKYPVEEYFDPAIISWWYTGGEEALHCAADDSADIIAKIPAGESVKLLQWKERFALVSYGGLQGYVLGSRIKPANDHYFAERLDTVIPTKVYTYEQMLADIAAIQTAYPNAVETASIGKSEQGRQIPVLRIGSLDAKYHVLLQGAIHAREHMTAWLLMAMADYWLDHGIGDYGDVCWHIIPMSNPDGVAVSQSGILDETQRSIYRSDQTLGYTTLDEEEYAARWKANAVGTDLNRNFPSGWETIVDHNVPAFEKFRGEEPFSAAEAKALRDYTLAYPFDATISYHATGSVIYYEFGRKQPANSLSKALGEAVNKVTGYDLEGCDSVDGAGYKDWAIDALGIPSLTMEIGCEAAPLAEREIYSVFARNYRVLPTIAQWLRR